MINAPHQFIWRRSDILVSSRPLHTWRLSVSMSFIHLTHLGCVAFPSQHSDVVQIPTGSCLAQRCVPSARRFSTVARFRPISPSYRPPLLPCLVLITRPFSVVATVLSLVSGIGADCKVQYIRFDSDLRWSASLGLGRDRATDRKVTV